MLFANKQKMFYATYKGETTEYELDRFGNKIIDYIDDDGIIYYRETGNTIPYYSEPVEFYASISAKLNEMQAKEFGVDQSNIYSTMNVPKGFLKDIRYGTIIWRTSEITYKDDEKTMPDITSADYIVKGLQDEYINSDKFLLQRLNYES